MKRFKFTSTGIIEAKNEEDAKEIFANDSLYFAANAECEEIKDEEELIKQKVIIEVKKGMAEVVSYPDNVKVIINDLDINE